MRCAYRRVVLYALDDAAHLVVVEEYLAFGYVVAVVGRQVHRVQVVVEYAGRSRQKDILGI